MNEKRKDLLIETEVQRRIEQSSIPELKEIVCSFRQGVLTLQGIVPSFELEEQIRKAARELIQGIEGIAIIDSRLVVLDGQS